VTLEILVRQVHKVILVRKALSVLKAHKVKLDRMVTQVHKVFKDRRVFRVKLVHKVM
jgi:hypothetical protein